MDVVVTGGAGFIGSALAFTLNKKGHNVIILDKRVDKPSPLEDVATTIRVDLSRKGSWFRIFKDVEVVFHLAANSDVRQCDQNPEDALYNVKSVYNVLEAIRNEAKEPVRLIYVSSAAVYGSRLRPPFREYEPPQPLNLYTASKAAGEMVVQGYARRFDAFKNYVIVRASNVVGRGMRRSVIVDFIERLKKNPRELVVLGDGGQKRDFVHIRDVVRALLTLMDHGIGIYNLGSGSVISVKEVAEIVSDVMGLRPQIRFEKERGSGWKGDPYSIPIDISRIRSLGWSPSLVGKEVVKRAAEEYLD